MFFIQDRDISVIAKAIRCPRTDDENLKKEKAKLRREIKLLLDRVLMSMESIYTTNSTDDYAKMNIVKDEIPRLIAARRSDVAAVADLPEVDDSVTVSKVPDHLYQ